MLQSFRSRFETFGLSGKKKLQNRYKCLSFTRLAEGLLLAVGAEDPCNFCDGEGSGTTGKRVVRRECRERLPGKITLGRGSYATSDHTAYRTRDTLYSMIILYRLFTAIHLYCILYSLCSFNYLYNMHLLHFDLP